jgi:hypothetical protein
MSITVVTLRRSYTHKENEAIQFEFDVERDECEEVANDMAKAGLIMEEDARIVFKLLKSQLISLNRSVAPSTPTPHLLLPTLFSH